MVNAEEVIRIYRSLSVSNIPIWLTGGWGIDALLREQTRPHKDLDILMLLDDIARMGEVLLRLDDRGNRIPAMTFQTCSCAIWPGFTKGSVSSVQRTARA